ncbi:MAG: cupin domain-containing protein [Candidatus Limnocylindria bacterium]
MYGWSNGPGDTYGEHEHGYTKVLYCTQGSIDFVPADDRRVSLGPGDRLVLPPRTRHSALVGPEGCACVEGKLPPALNSSGFHATTRITNVATRDGDRLRGPRQGTGPGSEGARHRSSGDR